MLQRIKNYVSRIWPREYRYDVLPPREMRAAMELPWVRSTMIQFSLDEYERNPYYASVINKQAEQTIGPCPTMIAHSEDSEANDLIEDSHLEWTKLNHIGKSLREFRRKAALTGIGLALRYKVKNTEHPVKVGFKIYGGEVLKSPIGSSVHDRIIDGIQYDEDWEPEKFFICDEFNTNDIKEYDVSEIIFWSRGYENGRINPIPECISGFTVYPFIRRYLQASIEAAEFRTSFPMALELDPTIYKSAEMKLQTLEKFQYKPRSVPTLPVGTTLKGLPQGASADQTERIVRTMASACALAIDMPANLALGDSSDSNMASAQVDIQPWKNHVNIDRFDLYPVKRRMFKYWYERAKLIRGLTPANARIDYPNFYPHSYVYDPLFQHPDPLKNANARAIDMVSGAATLNQIYAELGKNARRQIEREAKLLNIEYDELVQHILASRTNLSIQILSGETEDVQSQ